MYTCTVAELYSVFLCLRDSKRISFFRAGLTTRFHLMRWRAGNLFVGCTTVLRLIHSGRARDAVRRTVQVTSFYATSRIDRWRVPTHPKPTPTMPNFGPALSYGLEEKSAAAGLLLLPSALFPEFDRLIWEFPLPSPSIPVSKRCPSATHSPLSVSVLSLLLPFGSYPKGEF